MNCNPLILTGQIFCPALSEKQGSANETCPSFDCEYCTTYPALYEVKCQNIKYCIWKNKDFKKGGIDKMEKNNYCDNQDICKLLLAANSHYEKVVKQNKDLQAELRYTKKENKNYIDALNRIKDCATTEMVEISTRADYNGFIALAAISAKIDKVLNNKKPESEEQCQ